MRTLVLFGRYSRLVSATRRPTDADVAEAEAFMARQIEARERDAAAARLTNEAVFVAASEDA